MADEDEKQPRIVADLSPLTKGVAGVVSTILIALIMGSWATVNNSSIELVRLQTKVGALEEKVTGQTVAYQEQVKDLSTRVNNLEARVSVLQEKNK